MTNPTIETDLKEILKELKDGQNKIIDKVDAIDKRLTKVESKLDNAVDDIKEIKSTQKVLVSDIADLKGAKSLIMPIVVAVTVSILTLVIRSIPGV